MGCRTEILQLSADRSPPRCTCHFTLDHLDCPYLSHGLGFMFATRLVAEVWRGHQPAASSKSFLQAWGCALDTPIRQVSIVDVGVSGRIKVKGCAMFLRAGIAAVVQRALARNSNAACCNCAASRRRLISHSVAPSMSLLVSPRRLALPPKAAPSDPENPAFHRGRATLWCARRRGLICYG